MIIMIGVIGLPACRRSAPIAESTVCQIRLVVKLPETLVGEIKRNELLKEPVTIRSYGIEARPICMGEPLLINDPIGKNPEQRV
jgi:hypothetical protein